MGGIGRNLKKKAEAFDMEVQYHNRTQLSEELSGGAKYVSFEELLKTSDVLSLNLPLNVDTPLLIFQTKLTNTAQETNPSHNQHERIRNHEKRYRNR